MRRKAKLLGLGAVVLVLGLVWMDSHAPQQEALPPARPPRPVFSHWSAQPLAAPSGEHGTEMLGGRVLGPDGPVSSALVVALSPPSAEWRSVLVTPEGAWDKCPRNSDAARLLEWVEAHRHEALPLAHATTDAQGRFLLEGLPREPFVLWAERGVLLGLREGVSAGAREQDVHVQPGVRGQEVGVRLARGATLEGRVESDGVPVKVGTVQLRSQQGDIAGTTELWHGRYALELLPAGRYVVRVQGPRGGGPALLFPLRTVELAAGDRVTLDITGHITAVSMDVLVPGRDIEVHLHPGELPLLSPRQGLYNKLSAAFMGKRVSDGVRHFSQLPGGRYTLIAIRHDDSGTDVHLEQVELPSEGELSFTLAPLWNRFED